MFFMNNYVFAGYFREPLRQRENLVFGWLFVNYVAFGAYP